MDGVSRVLKEGLEQTWKEVLLYSLGLAAPLKPSYGFKI